MPFGTFLDQFPAALFIAAHLMFLGIGAWAVYATGRSPAIARGFVLYAVTQVVLLSTFAGVLTLKMGVLLEQTLVAILVVIIAMAARGGRETNASGVRARPSQI